MISEKGMVTKFFLFFSSDRASLSIEMLLKNIKKNLKRFWKRCFWKKFLYLKVRDLLGIICKVHSTTPEVILGVGNNNDPGCSKNTKDLQFFPNVGWLDEWEICIPKLIPLYPTGFIVWQLYNTSVLNNTHRYDQEWGEKQKVQKKIFLFSVGPTWNY